MLGSYKSLFQGIVTGIQFVVKRTDYGTDFTAILWIYIILLGPHLKSSDRHVNVCVHVCLAGISRLFSLTSSPSSWFLGEWGTQNSANGATRAIYLLGSKFKQKDSRGASRKHHTVLTFIPSNFRRGSFL